MICVVFLIRDFIKIGTVEGSRIPILKERMRHNKFEQAQGIRKSKAYKEYKVIFS